MKKMKSLLIISSSLLLLSACNNVKAARGDGESTPNLQPTTILNGGFEKGDFATVNSQATSIYKNRHTAVND